MFGLQTLGVVNVDRVEINDVQHSAPEPVVTSAAVDVNSAVQDSGASTPASIEHNIAVGHSFPAHEKRLMERKARVNYSQVWMGPIEIDLLLRHIDGVKTYLEWGSGGSTRNFPQFVTRRIVSIEHNAPWCGVVSQAIADKPTTPAVEYRCVKVEQGFKGWGLRNGYEEGDYVAFKEYVDEIERLDQERWDFVLVDGRARVDCAIKALSHLHEKSVLVLHDSGRLDTYYADILKYYAVLDRASGDRKQGIAALKRRSEFRHLEGDHAAVQGILNTRHVMV